MEKRFIGNSGLEATVYALGTMPLGGGSGWGQEDEQQGIETIHAALDLGINILDTAESYNNGRAEEIVGKALEGRRDKVIIATKISPQNTEPATLRAHCEASLKRLRTDYIDLYQVHWPIRDHSVADALATMEQLQTEGKIRAIGVSNHGVQDLQEVLATGAPIVSNQMHYNLLSRAIEAEIVPLCQQHGIDIIAYMPLLQGLLVGLYDRPEQVPPFRARTRHFKPERSEASRHGQPGAEEEVFAALRQIRAIADDLGVPMVGVALAWVAAKPFICNVLVGSRKPQQLVANIQAALEAEKVFTPDTVAELDRVTEEVRLKLGNNPDYWQSGEASRSR
ncbi:MAG: aldo/keto reductase [Chloroflexi bacterium]|nr:aldo/keto reductase [Chloroflexota bacterium]